MLNSREQAGISADNFTCNNVKNVQYETLSPIIHQCNDKLYVFEI